MSELRKMNKEEKIQFTQQAWELVREEWNLMVDIANGDKEETDDINVDSLDDYGLSFDYVEPEGKENGYWRYQLSWGGPGTELRFFLARPDLEAQNYMLAEFVFLDWGSLCAIDISKDPVASCMWDHLSPRAFLSKGDE